MEHMKNPIIMKLLEEIHTFFDEKLIEMLEKSKYLRDINVEHLTKEQFNEYINNCDELYRKIGSALARKYSASYNIIKLTENHKINNPE